MTADNGKVDVFSYRGTPQTVQQMVRVATGDRGQKNFKLRETAEKVVRQVRPKDYWSETLALYYWLCGPQFRYTRDPERVELVKDPMRMLWEVETHGRALGDCDDLATLMMALVGSLGGQTRVVTVGFRPTALRQADPRVLDGYDMNLITSPHPRLPGPFTHVFIQAKKPKGGWVTLDPVAGPRTEEMHRRVKQVRFYVPE